MSSTYLSGLSLSVFGESHGNGIGVVLDRLPPGESIDLKEAEEFLKRRAPGQNVPGSTSRTESDHPTILSGLYQGKTTGTPLCTIFSNQNVRAKDYDQFKTRPRPGHADYTGSCRYRGFEDPRGGGHFSGRLTAPITFAGAICDQILKRKGITIAAHIAQIHGIQDVPFDPVTPNLSEYSALRNKKFPVLSAACGEQMAREIEYAKKTSNSVGGIIECIAIGVPAGIGSPIFQGMENELACLLFGIPAVRGLEFGAGFAAAEMTGLEHNDVFFSENGVVKTKTNHHGGILGGITSGMPLIFRVCIKPTPSVGAVQQTLNKATGQQEPFAIPGRHDSCIVPRALPVVEAVTAIALLSQWLTAPPAE